MKQLLSGPALVPMLRFGAVPGPAKRIDEALACLARGQWMQAYALFAGLADEGDAHAARMALLMQRRGTRLFGGHFQVGAARRARWLDAAQPRSP